MRKKSPLRGKVKIYGGCTELEIRNPANKHAAVFMSVSDPEIVPMTKRITNKRIAFDFSPVPEKDFMFSFLIVQ